jgi:hypothetical protein
MKKWTWFAILLCAGIALFLWSARENFQDTASLRGPPYGDSDYPTIVNLMSSTLVTKLQDNYVSEKPGQNRPDPTTLEGQRILVDGMISSLMGQFHTDVYQPATTALTESNVDTFLELKAKSGFLLENKVEIRKLLVDYFVNQTAGDPNAELTDAQKASNSRSTDSGYAKLLSGLGQVSDSDKEACKQEVNTKSWDEVSEKCKNVVTNANTGNTTGGSSLIPQPNSGGSSGPMGIHKGNIWGPAFTGLGDNSVDGLGSGTRDYPTLIGPQPKESRMVEGAGISKPSIHTQLSKSGGLPSAGSTGSSEESKFFGTSRLPASSPGSVSTSPGDQDMYPGFFGGAGSTAYTPSSGSSKTDPVPFLSDFSAFLK